MAEPNSPLFFGHRPAYHKLITNSQGDAVFQFLSSEPPRSRQPRRPRTRPPRCACTTCYMCACRCGIRVHLRQGEDGPEVRYIDGNPEHPLNQGVICAKGARAS